MPPPKQKSPYRSFYQSKLFWAVMIALVLGLLAWGRLNNIREYAFSVRLDDVETPANVRVALGEGIVDIATLDSNSDVLFDADISAPGLAELSTNTASDTVDIDLAYIQPSPLVAALFGSGRAQQKWNLHLHPYVPTSLTLEGGIGGITADIDDLNLTDLTIEGGLGALAVDLPAPVPTYSVQLEGGLGNVNLTIPRGADIDLTIEGDVGSVNVQVSEQVNAAFNIETGLGDVTIDVNESSPLQVLVEPGLGSINLPDYLIEVAENRYETENFESFGAKITINYEGSVGDFTVR